MDNVCTKHCKELSCRSFQFSRVIGTDHDHLQHQQLWFVVVAWSTYIAEWEGEHSNTYVHWPTTLPQDKNMCAQGKTQIDKLWVNPMSISKSSFLSLPSRCSSSLSSTIGVYKLHIASHPKITSADWQDLAPIFYKMACNTSVAMSESFKTSDRLALTRSSTEWS